MVFMVLQSQLKTIISSSWSYKDNSKRYTDSRPNNIMPNNSKPNDINLNDILIVGHS